MKKAVFLFLIMIPLISFAQLQAPEDFEEAKGFGVKFLELMPRAAKEGTRAFIFQLKRIWSSYLTPLFKWIWSLLETEVEERKPLIKEEFEKEKEEMKQEIPKAGRSVWERFKDLVK